MPSAVRECAVIELKPEIKTFNCDGNISHTGFMARLNFLKFEQ